MMKIVLIGEVPSKKNSRINTRSGRSFPNPRYTQWHDYAILQVRSQLQGWTAPEPCSFTVHFFHDLKRRRDSDNAMSSLLDMLKDNGTIRDDCWEIVRHIEIFNDYDKCNPRCEIEIEKYEETI